MPKVEFVPPSTIVLEVKQSDINKGVQLDPEKCALGLAMKRVTKEYGFPTFDDRRLVVLTIEEDANDIPKHMFRYTASKKALAFMTKFDTDKKSVKPDTFTLRLYKA